MGEGEREDNKEKVSEQNEGEQKEEGRKNEEHVVQVKDYGSMVESELSDVCAGILKLLDSHLIPSASANESKVFYLKMTSNYHRYVSEFKVGTQRKEAAEDTMPSYKAAQDIDLAPTHPIRLGLALNFSVFYHEIQNASEKACSMAKQAVKEAIAELAFRCPAFHRDMRLSMLEVADELEQIWLSGWAPMEENICMASSVASTCSSSSPSTNSLMGHVVQ